jgi:phosphate transport system substrate-binding protein
MRIKSTLRFIFIVLLLCVSAFWTGCGRSKMSITMAGSTAFQPFAEKLAEQYMSLHPDIHITVQGGGSAVGIQSAISGAAQIGMADLVVLPEEAKSLHSTAVARDGISVVVYPSNSVVNLTTEQIRGIFNGRIRNWKEVGGIDAPVTVVSREAGSGTRSSFEQIIGKIKLTGDAIIQDSNGTIRETVANDKNSVGYLSHGLLNEKIKALLVDGIECTIPTIKDGTYPLVRPVFLLTQTKPEGAVAAFIDYILSANGQKTIETDGLISVR